MNVIMNLRGVALSFRWSKRGWRVFLHVLRVLTCEQRPTSRCRLSSGEDLEKRQPEMRLLSRAIRFLALTKIDSIQHVARWAIPWVRSESRQMHYVKGNVIENTCFTIWTRKQQIFREIRTSIHRTLTDKHGNVPFTAMVGSLPCVITTRRERLSLTLGKAHIFKAISSRSSVCQINANWTRLKWSRKGRIFQRSSANQ